MLLNIVSSMFISVCSPNAISNCVHLTVFSGPSYKATVSALKSSSICALYLFSVHYCCYCLWMEWINSDWKEIYKTLNGWKHRSCFDIDDLYGEMWMDVNDFPCDCRVELVAHTGAVVWLVGRWPHFGVSHGHVGAGRCPHQWRLG